MLLAKVLQPVAAGAGGRFAACLIFMGSYPVLFCLDRGNFEILLVLVMGWALMAFSQRKFRQSFVFLTFTICLKLYPALLLLLYFRRRLIHWVILAPVIFVVLNGAILLTYPWSLSESCRLTLQHLASYNDAYNLGSGGIASSASAWNACRLGTGIVYSLSHHFHFVWPVPKPVLAIALRVYSLMTFAALTFLTLFILLIETASMRKAVLLLLYLTVSTPGGGDYKLMYVEMALIIFILMAGKRPGDLIVTGLLAFCLIPKHEIYLDFMGPSDSGCRDASVGIILNPLCILISMTLLICSGWCVACPLRFRLRLRKLVRVLHLPVISHARRQP